MLPESVYRSCAGRPVLGSIPGLLGFSAGRVLGTLSTGYPAVVIGSPLASLGLINAIKPTVSFAGSREGLFSSIFSKAISSPILRVIL